MRPTLLLATVLSFAVLLLGSRVLMFTRVQSRQIHVSGVSGSTFGGHRVRVFRGPRMFGDQHIQQNKASTRHVGLISKKWAVCTTVFPPSEAIIGVSALAGWMVVVVGDKGSADFNYTAANLVHLSVVDQQAFLTSAAGNMGDLLPWKHFGRKNVGYLYAIAHGAEVIWDFDDDNVLKPGVVPQVPIADSIRTLHHDSNTSCPAYNVYPDFMPSTAKLGMPPTWPRGFPLDLIRKPCLHAMVPADASVNVAIVQSLADNDPDVDGIYRLTRGVPFNFDEEIRHTIAVPSGTMTPFNAQATLFLRPAFWSLLLPVTVHGRVSDIWRSYVAQRLLWDAGCVVAFSPAMVDQFRSPHNYLADMQAEEPLYYKSGKLVNFLSEWQGTSANLAGRYEELMIALYERDYIGLQDVHLSQQWLTTLGDIGYILPPVAGAKLEEVKGHAVIAANARPLPASDQRRQPGGTKPSDASTGHNWAVFSTSKGLTPIMQHVAALDGWRVVVVAETQGIQPATKFPNITYLTLEQQNSLNYSIGQYLPRQGTMRKNVGYVYAISHGAAAVYDGDADSELLQNYVPMLHCLKTAAEVPSSVEGQPCVEHYAVLEANISCPGVGVPALNPLPMFGYTKLFPRGMPTQTCLTKNSMCFNRQQARPLIQQALTNGKPDAHARPYELSSDDLVTFDKSSFPLILPQGVLMPVNRHNTIFLQDALWSLLLPSAGDASDIYRGYLAQRLLWEVGANAAVISATCTRSQPFSAVLGRQSRVEEVVQGVLEAKLVSPSLRGRMLELYDHMVKQGLLKRADVDLLKAWLADLDHAGLRFPSLVAYDVSQSIVVPGHAKANRSSTMPHGGCAGVQSYESLTQQEHNQSFAFMHRWCVHSDKVLYININRLGENNMQEQVRLLHAAYRPFFRRVVFAGIGGRPEHINGLPGIFHSCDPYLTGVNPNRAPGFFAHVCLAGFLVSDTWHAITKGDEVGVFYINDDVVFSPCMLSQLDSNKVWYHSGSGGGNVTKSALHDVSGWHWKTSYALGGKATLQQSLTNAMQQSYGLMAERIKQRLKGGSLTSAPGQADTYYVPGRRLRLFVDFAQQLQPHHIMTEVAVPTILALLHDAGGLDVFSLVHAWGAARGCIMQTLQDKMPLHTSMNCSSLGGCVGMSAAATCQGASSLFALHPYKLSNTAAAKHWLYWWQSQHC